MMVIESHGPDGKPIGDAASDSSGGGRVGADRKLVKALVRGIAVLSAFSPSDVWLGNAELAQRTGLPRATISRITATLAEMQYLSYSRRRRQYRLGAAVLALGYELLTDSDVRHVARPMMQKLADAYGGVVALAARDGFHVINLETCHSAAGVVSLRLDRGTHAPLLETAFGRALLFALSGDVRPSLLEQLQRRYGDRWAPMQASLQADFEMLRRKGYCVTFGGWQHNLDTVGVPLSLTSSEAPLGLGYIGLAQLTRPQLVGEIGRRLVETAEAIQRRLH